MSSTDSAATSRLDSISRIIDRILSYVVAVLLLAMSAIVFGNVFSRYLLQTTLGWYEEVSRFMLIWIVFLGAVIALIRGDHLGIDVLLAALPKPISRLVIVFTDILVLVALAIMFYGAWEMAIDSLQSGWVASSVPIPYGWVYMVGPLSAGLMFIQTMIKTAKDISAFREVSP